MPPINGTLNLIGRGAIVALLGVLTYFAKATYEQQQHRSLQVERLITQVEGFDRRIGAIELAVENLREESLKMREQVHQVIKRLK